jgi:hypothetical protein
MNTCVLTFDETGTGSCLYSEMIDLQSIGSLEIGRATTIEFNNQSQFWEVRNPLGTVLFFSRSRADCNSWEHQTFNR